MCKVKKTILLDLDGVINEYTKCFQIDYIPPVKKGAVDFLEILSKNYDLKLFTSRNKDIVEKWVLNNGLDKYFSGITNIKEVCWLFVDDRCVRFNGNYDELLDDILNFKAWHENKIH